ncbi:hypothetical protein [Nitrosomonas sp. Nm166]|uniref:hypothetical protein n=1 Tax=Nitrosomonas sp. Nm166 TaxID=1881054 RepID=UPI0008E254E0|nr:hypothetical protein [Nitrosomonas sp. Nm166]SFF22686.1 hypothetical protein SAMN05428977_10762 [Nitrosomonas sp. Nm166]
MLDHPLNENKFKSLTAQIKDAEMQLQEHQRMVSACKDALIQKTQQKITTPSSLLLAGGIGFILSELTKNKPLKFHPGITEESHTAETSDISKHLMSTLNLLNSINALYTTFRASMKETKT